MRVLPSANVLLNFVFVAKYTTRGIEIRIIGFVAPGNHVALITVTFELLTTISLEYPDKSALAGASARTAGASARPSAIRADRFM